MTLLANRPIETTARPAEFSAPQGGTYVTTGSRPTTVGSYVNGLAPARAIRGRYVSLSHPPVKQTEGRYTDRG